MCGANCTVYIHNNRQVSSAGPRSYARARKLIAQFQLNIEYTVQCLAKKNGICIILYSGGAVG
jgi:hypothetical protein